MAKQDDDEIEGPVPEPIKRGVRKVTKPPVRKPKLPNVGLWVVLVVGLFALSSMRRR